MAVNLADLHPSQSQKRPPSSALRRRAVAAVLGALLLLGCAPVEVRVIGPGTPAPTATAAEQQQAEQAQTPSVDRVTEKMLGTAVAYLTAFAEACGAAVIAIALVQGLLQYFRFLLQHNWSDRAKDDIRLRLGRSLAVALEFEVAADILKTAVAPTLGVIAQLAAIIILRTLLNYFLEREIRQAETRPAGIPSPSARREESGTD